MPRRRSSFQGLLEWFPAFPQAVALPVRAAWALSPVRDTAATGATAGALVLQGPTWIIVG